MGFSQHGEVHFLKGVPGWSWIHFFIDFKGSGEASGDHLRPPLGDFRRPWRHFARRGGHFGELWESLGITLGALRVTLGSLGVPLGAFLRMWVTLCLI